ncbi:folylpolyglutamate synthase [Drosophila novamexicana]|uniref:folylpolyglutamate synthase n=1 Tax=Drosophila novamexicana TaxID=47314 RepID=UPI0011E60146|nr:folylpolyglutamate synthase [Drosophila novamexicana]
MFLLKSPVNRLRLIPLRNTYQCSNSFFKWTGKMPQAPNQQQQVQQVAKPTSREKSIESNAQAQQHKEAAINEPKLPKNKAVPPPKINVKDQRDKWLAKVSPKMQRKAKGSAEAEPAGGGKFIQQPSHMLNNEANSQHFGMPKQLQQPAWMQQQQQQVQKHQQKQQQQLKKPADDAGGGSAERKSWMNRMHGSQQTKQAQWLKDMQAKQQAGRDMQQQKMQQMKHTSPQPQSQSTQLGKPTAKAGTATATTLGAADAAEPPVEELPEPKTPERLAYLEAVKQLNSYQIHEPTAGRAQSKSSRGSDQVDPNIEHTLQCLKQTGFEEGQLERIPVIQVAGTKGRGSTCLLVEAILRAHGVKTGVLCAPHLFLTSERIRIDGDPMMETEFTALFGQLHQKLAAMQPPPSYTKLLTVMAFHAFRNAAVDVAIVEVGSGCANDCTNITSHARTIGISSLGWEQNFSLSNSMRDIAWAKAAIMKPKASVYTSASQTECCEVLSQRAKQVGIQLHRVPSYPAYMEANAGSKKLLTGANFNVKLNGSLAIQLAYDYLRRYYPEYVVGLEHNSVLLTPGATRGLEMFEQRGQFEVMKHDIFNVYLDSADTLESMMMCREWFYTRTRSSRSPKILLFSKVNEFNAKDLLTILRHNMRFEEACFVPSPSYFEGDSLEEQEEGLDKETKEAINWHSMEELQRARRNASNWRSLCEENGTRDNSHMSISIAAVFEHLREKYGKQRYGMRNELDVLVTGSRELVAGTIQVLQKMKDKEFGKWR